MSDTKLIRDEARYLTPPVTLKNIGPGTVYYGGANVSSTVNTGSVTSGSSLTPTVGYHYVSASESRLVVEYPPFYTQTYGTTSRTHAALTAEAVDETAATSSTPFGFTEAQANALVATVNNLLDDLTNVKQVLNAVIDDLT